MTCEHNYQFQGVVYSSSRYQVPGSGAHEREYEDCYYCTKCLDMKYINKRTQGNDYSKPIEGTMLK